MPPSVICALAAGGIRHGSVLAPRPCCTAIHLDGRWVKSTPAFNIELCEKFGLRPAEFDGAADSIYHPFELAGNRHMED